MPDFLSRLIGRARGDAPLLERRSAQPFEAVQPATTRELQPGSFDAESDTTDEQRAVRETSDSDATIAPSRRRAKRSDDAASSADTADADASREHRARSPASDEHAEREKERTSAHDHDVEPRAAAKKNESHHANDIIAAVAHRVEGKAENPPPIGIEIGARANRRGSDAPADGTSGVVKTRPRPASEPASATRAAKDANTGMPAPLAPITSRILAAQPAAAKSTSAPTVHVSIGRIEVRALTVAAPPQPRSSGRAAPRLTLDAYLRSRKAGGS